MEEEHVRLLKAAINPADEAAQTTASSLPEPDVEALDADELEALLAELNADAAQSNDPTIDYLDQLQAELAKNTQPTLYQNYTTASTNVGVQQGQQQQLQQQLQPQQQQQQQQSVGSYGQVNIGSQNFQQPTSVGGFHAINTGQQLQQPASNIAQVPRRQASPSRGGGGGGGRRQSRDPPSDEDEAKRLEKERIREENRERKKRWRETNTDRNKDNDLRCRVMKRAHRMFGDGNSDEKLAWIKDEFERRREKRMNKDKSRTDHTGSSGMFGMSDPSYQSQEFRHLHHAAQYSAAQIFDMFKRLLRCGNTNSIDYVVSYLGANPNVTHDLLEMGRANGIDLVNEAGLNHQPIPPPQIIQQPVQPPPVQVPQPEPEQQQDTQMSGLSGFEGIELPEGFEAIIADIQKTTENFRESPESNKESSVPPSQAPAESPTTSPQTATEQLASTSPEPAKPQTLSTDEDLEARLEDLPEDEMAELLAALKEEEDAGHEEPETKVPLDNGDIAMSDGPAPTSPGSAPAAAPAPSPVLTSVHFPTPNSAPIPPAETTPALTPSSHGPNTHLDEAMEEFRHLSRAESPDLDLDNEGGVTDEDLEKLLQDTGMDMEALAGALDMDGDFSLGLIPPPQTPEEQEPQQNTSTNFDALFTELQQAAEAAVKDREQQNAQFQSQQIGQFGSGSGSFSGQNNFYPYSRDSIMRMLSILVEKMPYQSDPSNGSAAAAALLAGQKRRASSPSGSYGYPGQHPSLKRPRHTESATVQLEGILHSSMPGMIPRPPYQTPMMREVDTEAVNKRAMQLKPPPYRPPPKANSPPVGITPLDPPKEKGTEAEKKIKAMGFPPMMAGIRKPVNQQPLMPPMPRPM